jgi:hypothetical protein
MITFSSIVHRFQFETGERFYISMPDDFRKVPVRFVLSNSADILQALEKNENRIAVLVIAIEKNYLDYILESIDYENDSAHKHGGKNGEL